jgi:LmbE family N-acetylglucosaminyl deacetylase
MKTTTTKLVNLILSPHLDDAIFSLGGLLTTHAQESTVITIFAGTPTRPVSRRWDRACGFTDSTQAMETRRQEDIVALTSLGIQPSNITHWEYLDKQYRTNNKENLSLLAKEIREKIEAVLDEHKGKDLHIYAPLTGLHIDHRIVRDTVNNVYASKFETDPNVILYYYQDMPYTFRLYLFRRLALFFRSKKMVLNTLNPFMCTPEDIAFDGSAQEQKINAMKKYASQFKSKFSDISFLIKTATRFGAMQALLFRSKYPFCEVVYKKRKSSIVQVYR